MSYNEDFALATEMNDESMVWNLIYIHLNSKSTMLPNQINMVIGLSSINLIGRICERCVYEKMHRLVFTSWRPKTPLDLVHPDVYDPNQTLSHNGRRYFLLFVDDNVRTT